jgi:hypothetical protein
MSRPVTECPEASAKRQGFSVLSNPTWYHAGCDHVFSAVESTSTMGTCPRWPCRRGGPERVSG